MSPQPRKVYRVLFMNQGKVYEMYAESVSQGSLLGFIEIERPLFGERSAIVVDPGEETLKTEFKGVERFSVPIHSVLRIDEVEKPGSARITALPKGEGVVAPFPGTLYDHGGKEDKGEK